jgi:tRNA C32,U32 (ribose-2'-O)-methylase TrmJ
MYSDNKQIRDVADVAAKIMYGQQPVTEKLHPNQQQLDVHEPEKDELTADDFKKLRAKKEVKKEEVEELMNVIFYVEKLLKKHSDEVKKTL